MLFQTSYPARVARVLALAAPAAVALTTTRVPCVLGVLAAGGGSSSYHHEEDDVTEWYERLPALGTLVYWNNLTC